MEAIVLAGGFGTRLREVVSDVPKPMAQVAGRPFLEWLLEDLSVQGYSHVVLATGYKHESIEQHFGNEYCGLKINHAVETVPLGTGGAIVNGLTMCGEDEVTVLNGDTFLAINHKDFRSFAEQKGCGLTMVAREVDDAGRYGSVVINEEGKVMGFEEKSEQKKHGHINGGIYRLKASLLAKYRVGESFSFEKEVLQQYYRHNNVFCYTTNCYFIDIGIPEDYHKAQRDFAERRPER